MSYESYQARLANLLRHYKVPESEYSFNGEKTEDCIFAKQQNDLWYVYQSENNETLLRGMFYSKFDAYDFVFYLVMKNHRSFKKTWW